MPRTLAPLAALAALLTMSQPAAAQHDHGASPYAHTQSDEYPTLTPEEVAELENGEGMGLARPAELNHFPGPKHLLELAEPLGLGADLIERIEAIRSEMSTAAIAKGREILMAERHLGELFASGSPSEESLARITGHLGTMRGELQAIHLRAHMQVTALLTEEQIVEYDRLRGYGG